MILYYPFFTVEELASVITSLKKMIAQRVSPSLARLLQQPQVAEKAPATGQSSNNGGRDGDKSTNNAEAEQNGSLFSRAKWIASSTHSKEQRSTMNILSRNDIYYLWFNNVATRVAGRMDAFVEEVLNLAKSTQAKHPLIKRLSSGCNSAAVASTGSREISTPAAPRFSSMETPMNHLSAETPETNFSSFTPSVYEYAQRSGVPTALDLSSMIRTGSERFHDYHQSIYGGSRQVEWGEYSTSGVYNAVSMGDDVVYDTTAYITAYHPQGGNLSTQEFPVTYPTQFYDAMNTQNMNGYQNLQQVSDKVAGSELTILPSSTDVPGAENAIAVNCPQRLSVIT